MFRPEVEETPWTKAIPDLPPPSPGFSLAHARAILKAEGQWSSARNIWARASQLGIMKHKDSTTVSTYLLKHKGKDGLVAACYVGQKRPKANPMTLFGLDGFGPLPKDYVLEQEQVGDDKVILIDDDDDDGEEEEEGGEEQEKDLVGKEAAKVTSPTKNPPQPQPQPQQQQPQEEEEVMRIIDASRPLKRKASPTTPPVIHVPLPIIRAAMIGEVFKTILNKNKFVSTADLLWELASSEAVPIDNLDTLSKMIREELRGLFKCVGKRDPLNAGSHKDVKYGLPNWSVLPGYELIKP